MALLAAHPAIAAAKGGASDFAQAAVQCDLDAVNAALEVGANPNWTNEETGESVLHYAVACESGAEGNQYAMVRALIAAGAVATASTLDGESVLERALYLGAEPTISLLLESGADPSQIASTGSSVLALAGIIGNLSAKRAIEAHGGQMIASDAADIEKWGGLKDFSEQYEAWEAAQLDSPPAVLAREFKRFVADTIGDHALADIDAAFASKGPFGAEGGQAAECCGTETKGVIYLSGEAPTCSGLESIK